VSKGLVSVTTGGRTIKIQLTEAGRNAADELMRSPDSDNGPPRQTTKTSLRPERYEPMKFIYETFPEWLHEGGQADTAMNIHFYRLVLNCRKSIEEIDLSASDLSLPREISAGKSSIVRLIDYCL